ncbi:MAG: transcriptional repressor [Candidatus Eremiobacterota bacterium]
MTLLTKAIEKEIFIRYLNDNNLNVSQQRQEIAEIFFSIEKHLTVDEIYTILKKKRIKAGYTTVYRTMKLLCECNLAQERMFGDGQTRYEHVYGHTHHDHLICIKCRKIHEFHHPQIERLQLEMAEKNNFKSLYHKLEIYGICKECEEVKSEESRVKSQR